MSQETARNNYETNSLQHSIPGESPVMKEVHKLIERAIQIPCIHVSLHGEPGTGKKLVARTIHELSSRREHPFISINTNAIPDEEMEEHLFGSERGAFSDALMKKKGKFEEVGEGTLFLDEVSDLSQEMQIKLLTALQQGSTQRLGSQDHSPINCRIITSANGDLLENVKNHHFREDLYYYLVGLPITLPPLRNRGRDILLLANHFLKKFCKTNQIKAKTLSPQSQEKLLEYTYPGNIRELKAVTELAATLSTGETVEQDHIVFDHFGFQPMVIDKELTLREYNEQIILHFLKKYKSVKEVANRLEIGKSTIYNLLKQHNHFRAD